MSLCLLLLLILSLGFLTPLILLPNLRFLLGTKIIRNIERLANFLRCLPLDHTGHGSACQIQEWLDIHVVGGQNQLKEKYLFDGDKVGIPLLDHLGHLGRFEWLFDFGHGFGTVMLAEFNDLFEDGSLDVGKGDFGDSVLIAVLCARERKRERFGYGKVEEEGGDV